MTLEERLQRRLREWQKLARRYRIAQDGCDVDSDEWWLNKENVEMIERLSAELAGDLAADLVTDPTLEKVVAIVRGGAEDNGEHWAGVRDAIDVPPVDDAAPF